MTVYASTAWASNAELIEDVAALGYLRAEWKVLDPTYGLGTFWKNWRPNGLVGCDLDIGKSPMGCPVDFTNLPFDDGEFDAVVFDPPYKLNGTPTESVDGRYGVDVVRTWQERHQLIRDGINECGRVLKKGGVLLLKCQDQVCSGHVRWQTDEFTQHALRRGLVKIDRFNMLGGREQPSGRRQVHARNNSSALLVFKKGGR